VLPGGGAKGAVQLGMLDEYIKVYGAPQAVIGTSVGALNGALVASEQYVELHRIWNSIKSPDDVYKLRGMSRLFAIAGLYRKSSIFTMKPLEKLITKELDMNKLRMSHIQYFACAWNATTNQSEIFSKDHGSIMQGILASASIPIVFPEVKMGNDYYFDGGVTDAVPLKWAFSPRIGFVPHRVVILMPGKIKSSTREEKPMKNVFQIAPRVIDGLTEEGKKNDIALMLARNKLSGFRSVEVMISEPVRSHMGTLDFYPKQIREGIEIGRQSFLHNTTTYSEENNFDGAKKTIFPV